MSVVSKKSFGLSTLSLSIGMALSNISFAQEVSTSEAVKVEKIAVVGSRAAPRSVTSSSVPIDIIDSEEVSKNGATDMSDLIGKVVPSYNVSVQPISDAATLVRPANMRGMAPDHTLVLVNGKRRHRAAVIAFQGPGISNGAQGPDISVIPAIALKQVEVLRDGAAAQYGSDAIAGVINFQLKDDSEGGLIEARYGQYYEGDGESPMIAANLGLPVGDNGFINLSAEYKTAAATSRSVQRDDAQGLIDEGKISANGPVQIWGNPETKEDIKLFVNSGFDINSDTQAYLFGNYAKRDIEGGFYYRNPETRDGVYADPDGNPLIADISGNWDENNPQNSVCFGMTHEQALASEDCFSFQELNPNGFTPKFGGKVTDTSLVAGIKGVLADSIDYDFSASYGANEADFYIKNTVNASLGPDSPTEFDPGKYVQIEQGVSLDLNYAEIDTWHFASGIEYRQETFEIYAGDEASYTNGELYKQGFAVGSNGFPGFKASDAGSWSRGNIGMYVDVEKQVTDAWLVTGAVRYENYQDFGGTTNWKLSTLYNVTDDLGLRAALSTGFRAPTVGQSYVRNVTTTSTAGGLVDEATLPPTNIVSMQKGATALKPETSTNYSLGAMWTVGDLFVTADYYHIKLVDRISQSSPQMLTQADKDALFESGVKDAQQLTQVKFFTNGFDTTTQGVDLVVNYSPEFIEGAKFALAYNYTETSVDKFNPETIDAAGKVVAIENALPNSKGTLTWNQQYTDALTSLVRVNYYGEFLEHHADDPTLPIEVESAVTLDAEVSYQATSNWRVSVGAQNLLNHYPQENPYQGILGAKYPVTGSYGFNGGFAYAKVNFSF
ncbi:TonB-dependent siderophore receptor [Paraferrimonas sp. SM1919]|uniref:TonB-dependent receptor plug domain-containing protein n=1 Tax=Paraferrimonas sp. SM1919 TaxID=2662263 RepID=UPI0013D8C2E9|nr:TonB-dependent receptor [Paraferrimonas sp. SM1919]